MTYSPEGAGQRGLAVVPEESAAARVQEAARVLTAGSCEPGLDLDTHDALHHGNRLVASPSRRVSGSPMPAAVDAAALTNLQAENRTLSAIAEDRSREIQRLQASITESNVTSKAEVADLRARTRQQSEEIRCRETEKAELQKHIQELNSQIEPLKTEMRLQEARVKGLQEQVTKAQQDRENDLKDLRTRCDRRVQEKEAELQKALEEIRLLRAGQATQSNLSSASQPAADDTRRRLFPSTADQQPLFAGANGTPSFSTNDMVAPVSTDSTVHSVASSAETVPRSNAFGQPPQPPAPAASAGRPVPSSMPRATRSNSLTRPAFRPMPGTLSPGALSPGGLAKCLSTGHLPPTPRLDQEAPMIGCVKEKIGLFEQKLGTGTPKRSSAALTEGRSFASFIADSPSRMESSRTMPPLLGGAQRSPVEQRWREDGRPAIGNGPRQANADRAQFPGLDMAQGQDAAMDDQVNFNMSPMRRHH